MFTHGFSNTAYPGATISGEVDGFTATATIHRDDDTTPPWKRADGHGPVSDWRQLDTKAPGELVLATNGWNDRDGRFYDFADACRIARRDGWGTQDGRREGESASHYASRPALADYDRLRGWCNDQWEYVGVAVTVSRAEVVLLDQYLHALWGIESDGSDYLNGVANELLDEALESAHEAISALTE